jgi:hypothetical protein
MVAHPVLDTNCFLNELRTKVGELLGWRGGGPFRKPATDQLLGTAQDSHAPRCVGNTARSPRRACFHDGDPVVLGQPFRLLLRGPGV